MNKVAIVIWSYNRPTLIQKAIRSVLAQTYRGFRIYIVDNNSCDEVKKILREYRDIYPEIIVLHFFDTKNKDRFKFAWISKQMNWGVKNSKEPYISSMTDDTWYHPKRLELMVKYLDRHPEAKIVYGPLITLKKDGTIHRKRDAEIVEPPHNFIDPQQAMYRRSVFKEVGYWNESSAYNTCMDREFFDRVPYRKYPVPDAIAYELEHNKRWMKLMKKGGPAKGMLVSGGLME